MAKKPLTRDELMRLAKKAAAEVGKLEAENHALRATLYKARSLLLVLKRQGDLGVGDKPGQVRPQAVDEIVDEIDEPAREGEPQPSGSQ